jgi:GntR family transcriptional regulator / MocR family aminotransferase
MAKAIRRSELLLSLNRKEAVPLRQQLERALRTGIQFGQFRSAMVLPSSRVLAAELGVSRRLVVEVYEQLRTEGYLSSRPGAATSVAARTMSPLQRERNVQHAREPRYDFRPGRPDPSLFPRRAWLSALRRVLVRAPSSILGYSNPAGALAVRATIAEFVNRSRGARTCAEDIILCTGFAQAMRLTGERLRARGVKRIAVENPGHAFESEEVRATGLELVPVPVDQSGVNVDCLVRLRVGGACVTPAHQYPTGAVLSPARRAALLEWAAKTKGFVIEDDYDGEYRYDRDPVGALQGLAPDRVIYVGSASKTLAPALRIGWIASPPSLTQELTRAKLEADRGSPGLEQAALAEFIRCGDLDRHLRRSRLIYKQKRTLLAQTLKKHLPDLLISGVAAGLHLTIQLPAGVDETALVDEAERNGIRIHGLRSYCARPSTESPAILLGYCQPSERNLVQGVAALAVLVKSAASHYSTSRQSSAPTLTDSG